MREIRFWGKNWLECIGVSAGVALIMQLLIGGGSADSKGMAAMLIMEASLFPYYLFVGGAVVIPIVTISYFQVYFSVLLSMNSTRKAISRGILLTNAAVILVICIIAAIIWNCVPGGIAKSAIHLLPLLTGCLLIEGAVFTVLGFAFTKGSKAAKIILVAICMVIGGMLGASAALENNIPAMLLKLSFRFSLVLGIGILLYLLTCIFMMTATRKMEVKM